MKLTSVCLHFLVEEENANSSVSFELPYTHLLLIKCVPHTELHDSLRYKFHEKPTTYRCVIVEEE